MRKEALYWIIGIVIVLWIVLSIVPEEDKHVTGSAIKLIPNEEQPIQSNIVEDYEEEIEEVIEKIIEVIVEENRNNSKTQ